MVTVVGSASLTEVREAAMKLSPEELEDLLTAAGLKVAPGEDPGTGLIRYDYVFTQCLRCGAEAHYKPEYMAKKLVEDGEKTCRACYWDKWLGGTGIPAPIALTDIRRRRIERDLAEKGYRLIGAMGESTPDLLVIRCVNCGKQSVTRDYDVWRCECGGAHASQGVPYSQTKHQVPRPDFPRTFPHTDQGDPTGQHTVCGGVGPLPATSAVAPVTPTSSTNAPVTDIYQDGTEAALSSSTSGCLDWWDTEHNLPLTPETVTRKSRQWVWWVCPKCGLRFQSPIRYMEPMPECPICMQVDSFHFELEWKDFGHMVVGEFPGLRRQWDDETDPMTVSMTTYRLYKFRCPKGHHPRQTPSSYFERGCMVCNAQASRHAPNQIYLRQTDPELAAEWVRSVTDRPGEHHTPDNVKSDSRRLVLWECLACGHQWTATVHDRQRRCSNRCPACGKVMGSFAWKYPSLAKQWDPDNPTSPWNTKPYGRLTFTPRWICPKDPRHKWRATIPARIKRGQDCPFCAQIAQSPASSAHTTSSSAASPHGKND